MTIAQPAQALDPITLEVLWNRLLSVTNEQQVALMRTAFSTILRESQDLACGVFDTRGNMLAQSETGTPGHINAMATGMRHFLTEYPPEVLRPGDVLLTGSAPGSPRVRAGARVAIEIDGLGRLETRVVAPMPTGAVA